MSRPNLCVITNSAFASVKRPTFTPSAQICAQTLLDDTTLSLGNLALKRADLRAALDETPDSPATLAHQILNLQDIYRDGWLLCHQALNQIKRGTP